MVSQFYLSLPSNSSQDVFQENTLTHYKTQLPHLVDLSGKWEVGLAEIQYPHDWKNIDIDDPRFWVKQVNEEGWHAFELPSGYYDTPEELVKDLNECVGCKEIGKKTIYYQLNEKFPVTFHFQRVSQTMRLKVGPRHMLTMSNALRTFLGMDDLAFELPAGMYFGKQMLDLDHGFYSLFVYCDLVEHRIVGNSKVQLLRVVPVEGRGGEMVTKEYERIHYLPLMRKDFDTVTVDIRKDTGEIVPFLRGRVNVTLHFRKRLL